MRKWVVVGLGASGLLLAIAGAGLTQRASAPQSAEITAASTSPSAVAARELAPSSAARELARATAPVDTQEQASTPVSAAAPDLPTIEVEARPIHTVPEEDVPVPKVTLFDRAGREIAAPKAFAEPAPPARVQPASVPFTGAAQAAGGTTLAVAGRSVRLFGVRIGDPRDRCGLGPGDRRSCADVARDALAQRLRRSPWVSCQMPAGQVGDPGAVCVDASSTDLGGFLVAEGLALADTTQSYEYFGAEGVARSFRRGLWRHR
jgi:endonuclease YncB( thermonuclease family)